MRRSPFFVAWSVPLGWAITFAVKENLNPVNIGCLIAKAPLGCNLNGSDVSCERGTLSDLPEIVFAVSHFLVFLLFPPVSARKKLMKSCFCQLSLYLFTMWITWLPYLASVCLFYIISTSSELSDNKPTSWSRGNRKS